MMTRDEETAMRVIAHETGKALAAEMSAAIEREVESIERTLARQPPASFAARLGVADRATALAAEAAAAQSLDLAVQLLGAVILKRMGAVVGRLVVANDPLRLAPIAPQPPEVPLA